MKIVFPISLLIAILFAALAYSLNKCDWWSAWIPVAVFFVVFLICFFCLAAVTVGPSAEGK